MLQPQHAHDLSQAPIFIVMNAGSGDKDADGREAIIRDILSQAGRGFRIWRVGEAARLPEAAREAVELARQQKGVVVAAGGDGTINAVVQAVLGSGCPFGVLPQGTFNYFSRTHGIPLDTAEATRALLQGEVRMVQVGLVNDKAFVVNGSLGLYPELLEKREVHKQKFGRRRIVAMLSALTVVLRPPPQLVLTLGEGKEERILHVSTLLVENNRLQLKEVGLPEAEAVERWQLAAVVVKAKGIWQMLSVVLKAAMGRLAEAENVYSFPFGRLTVKPLRRRRLKVATDGEIFWMDAPIVFRVAPHPLLLLLPHDAKSEADSP